MNHLNYARLNNFFAATRGFERLIEALKVAATTAVTGTDPDHYAPFAFVEGQLETSLLGLRITSALRPVTLMGVDFPNGLEWTFYSDSPQEVQKRIPVAQCYVRFRSTQVQLFEIENDAAVEITVSGHQDFIFDLNSWLADSLLNVNFFAPRPLR